ncbi:tyrosine-type recombinase/integrase [Lentzea californiensis]|uniref:tyrosine-type recombinase/integrase n=1 Tax=Lentzea californiensis TaxID=438851 RepID=UPI0021647F42|nr:site-specific integrase [Lentzea californiensis]MCR3746669.1 Phage integrase, N-terminal SAM-like domain [Lentzea californiensis]
MPRKPRKEGTRAPNGASSIYYSESDGYWHGRVTMGTLDNGKPDRRHVKRKSESAVIDRVRELENERESGNIRRPGERWRVEAWLLHWLENIAKPSLKYKAFKAYESAVRYHLIPALGGQWMDAVEPDHFERLYARIIANGRKAATAHQVHRTARRAWGQADRRGGIIKRNAAALATPPRVEEEEVEPFEVDEVQLLIKTCLKRRNGVRFIIALVHGTRQGETIGLKWTRLDRKAKALRIRKALQRQTWKHGCENPTECGAKYHKFLPCKETCKRHSRKPCPPPCPPDCKSHARWCPKRHGGGLVEVDVKSSAGRRGVALVDQVFSMVLEHEKVQQAEREAAGDLWHDEGWMFAQPNGKPIDPRADLEEWKEVLKEAGIREARLHDARHTAATVLLVLGVPERIVMDLMGWSNSSMAKRYQHISAGLRRTVADQLGGLLWGNN